MAVMLALVFGGSAAVGVNSLVSKSQGARPNVEMVPVVVAVMDIPRGGMIKADLVRTREYPKDMVPPGAITKVQDALDRAVFIPLVREEPVLDAKLAPRGAGRGMAALIPQGMRAFTIHTPSVASGVAGFILPGNKVDVLLTMDSKGSSMTTTLLQNMEILAVDQRIDAPAENKVDSNQLRSVTLLVTPDQAAKLELGQSKGSLHLTLRNLKDDQPSDAHPARLADLEGYQEEPQAQPVAEAPKPAPPAPKFVTIYRGRQYAPERHLITDAPVRAGGSKAGTDDSERIEGPLTARPPGEISMAGEGSEGAPRRSPPGPR
jgi:pilus assembly protein CpaB